MQKSMMCAGKDEMHTGLGLHDGLHAVCRRFHTWPKTSIYVGASALFPGNTTLDDMPTRRMIYPPTVQIWHELLRYCNAIVQLPLSLIIKDDLSVSVMAVLLLKVTRNFTFPYTNYMLRLQR